MYRTENTLGGESMLKSFLFKVKDHRRKQGRGYELGHILLFTILAILSGADWYRKVQKFIVAHYDTLNENFDLNWKRLPAHTSLRDISRPVLARIEPFIPGNWPTSRLLAPARTLNLPLIWPATLLLMVIPISPPHQRGPRWPKMPGKN